MEKVAYIELEGKDTGGYFGSTPCVQVLKVIGSRGFTCPHMVKVGDVASMRAKEPFGEFEVLKWLKTLIFVTASQVGKDQNIL